MSPPEAWVKDNIGSETPLSGPMDPMVSQNFPEVTMMRAGSIVGIRARTINALQAGTLAATPTIDGAPVAGLTAIILAGQFEDGSTALPEAIPYGAGQRLGVQFNGSAEVANQGPTMEAWLEVYEELPPPAP
jgi:hypothetical protein